MNTMRHVASRLIPLGLAALLASSLSPAHARPAGSDVVGEAQAAAPMKALTLVELYRGKTWLWPDGAGYFDPSARFTAWSGSGRSATYAVGEWRVTNHGRLCMRAVWYSAAGARKTNSCFLHHVHGDVVYQAKIVRGAVQTKSWYVFKNAPPQADDQFNKLKAGDLVAKDLEAIKAQFPEASLRGDTRRKS